MRIIVYGTGILAKNCIESLREKNDIVAVIDRVKLAGEFLEIPIKAWEDIYPGDADCVYIAAPEKYYKEIYFRILPYTYSRKLVINTINGKDLGIVFGIKEKIVSNYITKKNDLYKLIDENEVISFDLFDTLIMRKVVNPVDVFKLVEIRAKEKGIKIEHFYKIRREAELKNIDGNIYQIYEEIKNLIRLSDREREILLKLEIECEKELLVPRNEMVQVYKYCLECGKKVIISTDMYLLKEHIEMILKLNEIDGYENIYVSCEYGVSKRSGLLKIVKQEYSSYSLLHIGDDIEADYNSAIELGIKAALIQRANLMAMRTPLVRCIGFVRSFYESLILGDFVEILFNSPFENAFCLYRIKDLVKAYYLPIALSYLKLIVNCINKKLYHGVIFVSRDGFFFYNCYNLLKEKRIIVGPEAFYILNSRKLSIRSGMDKEWEVKEVISFYNLGENCKELYELFGIKQGVSNICQEILSHSTETKYFYRNYLIRMLGDLNKEYLYCELNGHGTGYYYVNKFFDKNLDSAYLLRQHTQKIYDENISNAVVHWHPGDYSPLFTYTAALEAVFTSEQSSVVDFLSDSKIVFAEETRNSEQINLLISIQKELMEQVLTFCQKYELDEFKMSQEFLESLFETISEIELVDETSEFEKMVIHDDVLGGKYMVRKGLG